ncbi:(Fe-S)-binding protein [Thermohalobacter berrensis]|uniref:Fe-S cluster protein n=1 Tax=Thermohalobacter berrensis TaxID=99594 RepID=A0A419T8I9_9FIRM|nr:(Fe-S)-binding protein [Thermohalobacter berrensis]RKD33769.1 Fe-S cluster protein [Thermohalobacter berrensis]
MYLDEIFITYMQSCIADSKKIRFKGKLSTDIGEVLPYINRVIKNAIFNKNIPSLTFTKEFRIITLYKDSIAVSKAINETDAYEIIDMVKDLINNTYNNKDNIQPLYEMRTKPTAIELYNHLPKINCKRCGESTCMAFASKLLMGQKNIKKCSHLFTTEFKPQLERIKDLLQMMGYF